MRLRVLTVADLHQSRRHFRRLCAEVQVQRPDIVALVGDVLGVDSCACQDDRVRPEEAAQLLSALRGPQLVFVRGNHEQEDWPKFVGAWPLHKRPLVALYGTAHAFGPLVITGFPCHIGWEGPWCEMLPKLGNHLTHDFALSGRQVLPVDHVRWLPSLMRRIGPAGRTLWLMHEPPVALPIAGANTCNAEWTEAVERFRPLLTISGHDHETPRRYNTWQSKLGDTLCVNPGQGVMDLHYCLLDLEFAESKPCLPSKITVQAFPWKTQVVIQPE
jgi:Icc-related predicted phosphoesterase